MNWRNSNHSFLLILLAGCGLAQRGSDGVGEGIVDDVPLAPNCSSTTCLSPYAQQNLYYEVGTITPGAGDVLTTLNLPSWASFDASTGIVSGYPPDAGSYNFTVRKTNGGVITDYGPYTIFSRGDPLLKYAWFINNTGQKNFADYAGLAGEDLKVIDVWQMKDDSLAPITGDGIKIAVSDTGLEIDHQDLRNNIRASANRDYSSGVPDVGGDPTNTIDIDGDHGTSVGGLIAAEGWNGVGSRGIAPKALLSGLNFLNSSQSTALLIDQANGDFDVFNQSWGEDGDRYSKLPSSYISQILASVTNGRGGKGQIFVRAAGNSFVQYYNSGTGRYWSRPSNASADNTLPYFIVVGATNAGNTSTGDGEKSSYASAGSNLWVSAPGGEYGDTDPAMMTTDQSDCSRGYSQSTSSRNAFENSTTENKSCNYTSIFNGTSSAAPVTSGVVALILQANPDLTWRDVKHILASTADKIDSAWPNAYSSLFQFRSWDPSGYEYERPWVKNKAGAKGAPWYWDKAANSGAGDWVNGIASDGFEFHNWYGFGRINAYEAVRAAKNYTVNMGTYAEEETSSGGALGLAIPDNSAVGVSSTMAVTTSLTAEEVTVQLDISHSYTGDLAVELTSPLGTRSILFNINNSYTEANWTATEKVVFLSNAFYGELANGTWTLKVLDGHSQYNSAGGVLNNWKIQIYGH